MFDSGKKKGVTQGLTLRPATSPAPVAAPADPLALQRQVVVSQTRRPVPLQRQVTAPILKAAQLHTAEVQRLSSEQASMQRQAAEINLPQSAVDAALQRQQAMPAPVPTKPQSISDWVTVMRFQAEQSEGRRMGAKEAAQFTALQRQVAQTMSRSYLTDRQSALQRQQDYAGHVVALQRHPVSGQVSRAFMLSVPQSERPALQRAVDEAQLNEQIQRQQDEQALQLHSLQRQLAELNEQATKPVFERIQQRRGAGNPLPEAIQRHLEQGLNHNLSAVRIHDDAEADKLAKGVNAIAFTTGTDIYFQSGKFNPNSQSGLELLAHEVTHTVQQSKGQVGKGVDPDSGLESEARRMGRKLSNMKSSGAKASAKKSVQRAPLTVGHAIQRAGVANATEVTKLEKQLKSLNADLALTMAQAAADVAGIVDPTPISDGISAAISLYRGDFLGAGLSIISMIPGVGDAVAKPLKGSKLAAKIAKLEKEIKTVTQQLAKAKGVDLAGIQKTVNSTKQVVKSEVLKRLPKNWPQVSKIIGKKYSRSLLPSDYHEKIINGKPVIFRNPNKADDAITTPLAIDKNGNIVVKQLPDRISDPKKMRANYAAAHGKLKDGFQIHHIFPDNLIRSMPIGQAAEKAGVNLDRAENLIGLPGKDVAKQGDIGHWSSHPQYDALVERIVKPYQTQLIKKYGSLDLVPADKLREVMNEISDTLRDLIKQGKVPMKDGRISMNMTGSEAVA